MREINREVRMSAGDPKALAPETVVHRIGGGGVDNLWLKAPEKGLKPPGISVFRGGSGEQAADQVRHAFPDPIKFARLHELAETVGSATAAGIRAAGCEVIADPSARFPNHARIIHPEGVAGFSDANLERLSKAFQDRQTPKG
jgi:hypothetical protein